MVRGMVVLQRGCSLSFFFDQGDVITTHPPSIRALVVGVIKGLCMFPCCVLIMMN